MKKSITICALIIIVIIAEDSYAGIGEGISNGGSLNSIIYHSVGVGISDIGSLNSIIYHTIGVGISDVGTLFSNTVTNTIIITHGYTGEGEPPINPISETRWEHLIWQFAMADAVSENRDIYLILNANFYAIEATYSQFALLNPESSIGDALNNFIVSRVVDPAKDNVFIFDWTMESAVNWRGYAEAAADVLAAILVKLGKEYPFLLENLHFIGHSRGCVINSEAIERLFYWASNDMLPYGVILDPNIHITTLDPHPAGHWYTNLFSRMNDDFVNSENIILNEKRIGIAGWKTNGYKVAYIDNYWQDIAWIDGLSNYPGLDSSNNKCNNDLSTFFPIDEFLPHQLVHTWYHGTVSLTALNDLFGVGDPNIERTAWYNSTLGSTQGFYYSAQRLGNLATISSVNNNLIDVSEDTYYGNNLLVFNGDFRENEGNELPPLTPGWSYQDGAFPYHWYNWFNPCALLGYNNRVLIHNSLFIPTNAEKIHFRMKVVDESDVDELDLYIGNDIIRAYPINNTSRYKWFDADIPSTMKGTVNQIKFELTNINQNNPTVYIDDISFSCNNNIFSSVACPVNFHIYDSYGNHTGPLNDTTFTEQIPGSRYNIYKDSTGNEIKTVTLKSLSENDEYTFIIESQDTTSFFSYVIEDYSDTSKGTITFEFDSIAIEPNTVASCTLSTNIQTPVLKVDLNGDGQIDTTFAPVITGLCVDKNISLNWNLLSIPYDTEQKLKTELFPTAVSSAFWYNQGYIIKDTLEAKKSYWIKFDQVQTNQICGTKVYDDTIQIRTGWNMIGVLDEHIPVSQITTEPPGILVSNFFGYSSGYFVEDTLKPSYGYWIKSNADGIILLNSPLVKERSIVKLNSDWASITISDARSREVKLYLSEDADKEMFTLPPMPPEGAFDIRFSTGLMVESISGESKIISIAGAEYPIRIKVEGVNLNVSDLIDEKLLNETIRDGNELTIYDSRIDKVIINGSYVNEVPIRFGLEQNYPNPFNPSTSINYSIPEVSDVTLKVFDILGSEIMTLVNEKKSPGHYAVQFDSKNLSSGIYFYQLKASSYIQARKMILIK